MSETRELNFNDIDIKYMDDKLERIVAGNFLRCFPFVIKTSNSYLSLIVFRGEPSEMVRGVKKGIIIIKPTRGRIERLQYQRSQEGYDFVRHQEIIRICETTPEKTVFDATIRFNEEIHVYYKQSTIKNR